MDYTPGLIWSVLLHGSDDPDEVIDIQVGLDGLPIAERVFLTKLARGYTGVEAMIVSGLEGNQTRLKRQVLGHLTRKINGEAG